jgi:pyruvate dehydrogenase E2 component (dihydrolipoamide acetyltransferase)
MDPPLSLALDEAAAPPAPALAAARLQAFAPPGAPGAPAPAPLPAPQADLPAACAAAWDAAFAGPVRASPQALAAASAQLRACAVGVCEDMQRLCAAAARGEGSGGGGSGGGGGGGGGEPPTAALLAFRAAVAGMAAQLEVLRRQEALAELVAHATGASEASGLRGAQASLEQLQRALQALPL